MEWYEDIPKWRQIADEIRRRIETGEIPPRSRVPSQHDIVQEFGVSKGTARRALEYLRDAGIIHITPGLGGYAGPDPHQ